MELLQGYAGEDILYPATLKTLYAVRNAVYRFNKANGKRFRCVIRETDVALTERPVKTAHDYAIKDVTDLLSAAKRDGESDVETLVERIRDALTARFDSAEDEEAPAPRRRSER